MVQLVWSYGGGWQSVAIGVLIRQGVLPKPDIACIADTSREVGTTWEYLHEHMQPFLDPISLTIEVIPHTLSRVDLHRKSGLTIMPAYTGTNEPGLFGPVQSKGRLGAFCSGEWKRDTIERWLRLRGVKECETWIGFSLDEQRRVGRDHRPWCHLRYPLIERNITRAMCGELIQAAGLPLPRKSRCWCCPHQSAAEWAEVKARPGEWAAAMATERAVNDHDPREDGQLFLYQGRVPLAEADFDGDTLTVLPGRPCEGGHCFV